jgi:iron-sulfur cluster repair protein YtfE (RIC family)
MNHLLLAPETPECEQEWRSRSLSELATHISAVHHERLRDELPILTRQVAALSTRFGDGRVFQLRVLSSLLSEFRNEVDPHSWTEDDLLFPVLAVCENPTVLSTTLTSERLLRLVESLTADHARIRHVLARITQHIADVSDEAGKVPEWAELIAAVQRMRDSKLAEMDLEDRCLLSRARTVAQVNAAFRPTR